MSLRIVLADDHRIVREGLRALVNELPDMEVIGEAADGRTTVEMVRNLLPDVVIIDVGMPGLNGIEATRQIRAKAPSVKVVALSMHSDGRFVSQMLKAGAVGYLLKDCAFEELARALQAIMAHGHYLSPGLGGAVARQHLEGASLLAKLTAREREVLQLIAEGWNTKNLATRLHVSTKTVETHRHNIMKKLEVRSVAELTKLALREGVTTLEH